MNNPFATAEERAERAIPHVDIKSDASIDRLWILLFQILVSVTAVGLAVNTMLPAAVPYALAACALVVFATVRNYSPTLMYTAIVVVALSFLNTDGRAVGWLTCISIVLIVASVRAHSVLSLSSSHAQIELRILNHELRIIGSISSVVLALSILAVLLGGSVSSGVGRAFLLLGCVTLCAGFGWAAVRTSRSHENDK